MENTKIFLNRGREKRLSKMLVTLLVTAMLMSIMPMPRAHAAEDPPQFNEISGNVTLNGETRENLKIVGNVTITLVGENTVESTNDAYPGIWVPDGSTLTIKGNGTLTVSGCGDTAPAIGGRGSVRNTDDYTCTPAGDCGNIIIESGDINAPEGIGGGQGITGYSDDRGVNGGDCQSVTIKGGIISTDYIGGGVSYSQNGGACGSITITGGDISTNYIGGGNAHGFPGCDPKGGSVGKIIIRNCAIKNKDTSSEYCYCRIGGGDGKEYRYTQSNGGDAQDIEITDSTLTSCSIGGGNGDKGDKTYSYIPAYGGACGNITINGSTLEKTRYIGGGNGDGKQGGNCGTISITDSNIDSHEYGFHIGGGFGYSENEIPLGTYGEITISGGRVSVITYWNE